MCLDRERHDGGGRSVYASILNIVLAPFWPGALAFSVHQHAGALAPSLLIVDILRHHNAMTRSSTFLTSYQDFLH